MTVDRLICYVEPGKTYTISADVKTDVPIDFAFVDVADKEVGRFRLAPAGIEAWTRVRMEVVAPANAAKIVNVVSFIDRLVVTQNTGGKK